MTITDEQLEQREREVAELIGIQAGGSASGPDESRERIERILRRIRLENRIQEEAEATAQGSDVGANIERDSESD